MQSKITLKLVSRWANLAFTPTLSIITIPSLVLENNLMCEKVSTEKENLNRRIREQNTAKWRNNADK